MQCDASWSVGRSRVRVDVRCVSYVASLQHNFSLGSAASDHDAQLLMVGKICCEPVRVACTSYGCCCWSCQLQCRRCSARGMVGKAGVAEMAGVAGVAHGWHGWQRWSRWQRWSEWHGWHLVVDREVSHLKLLQKFCDDALALADDEAACVLVAEHLHRYGRYGERDFCCASGAADACVP